MEADCFHCAGSTSSPPMWKYWSGNSAAISPMKCVEELVGFLARGIHGGMENSPVALDRIRPGRARQLRISYEPTGGVARDIEFGDHANAAIARVGDNLPDFVLCVEMPIRTELLKPGKRLLSTRKPWSSERCQ